MRLAWKGIRFFHCLTKALQLVCFIPGSHLAQLGERCFGEWASGNLRALGSSLSRLLEGTKSRLLPGYGDLGWLLSAARTWEQRRLVLRGAGWEKENGKEI